MAFGFTPKYMEQISLDGLTPQQFLALCIETVERMQWSIDYTSNAGIVAHTGRGMFSSNFKLTVTIDEGIVSVQSESTGSELFDMGRNKKTVLAFIGSMESLKAALTPNALEERYAALAPGLPPIHDTFPFYCNLYALTVTAQPVCRTGRLETYHQRLNAKLNNYTIAFECTCLVAYEKTTQYH